MCRALRRIQTNTCAAATRHGSLDSDRGLIEKRKGASKEPPPDSPKGSRTSSPVAFWHLVPIKTKEKRSAGRKHIQQYRRLLSVACQRVVGVCVGACRVAILPLWHTWNPCGQRTPKSNLRFRICSTQMLIFAQLRHLPHSCAFLIDRSYYKKMSSRHEERLFEWRFRLSITRAGDNNYAGAILYDVFCTGASLQ
ncbi:unnamed protein product [Caenorhabditis auriculariae]|uniref:Uncharacterized protein n=1 Tax=Caenorhabditis auriculariae TaxID=2777116 RepID=A0A8S1HL79_9PELO|nr:unnamed protein product [Caenorhabditis auriculariae]